MTQTNSVCVGLGNREACIRPFVLALSRMVWYGTRRFLPLGAVPATRFASRQGCTSLLANLLANLLASFVVFRGKEQVAPRLLLFGPDPHAVPEQWHGMHHQPASSLVRIPETTSRLEEQSKQIVCACVCVCVCACACVCVLARQSQSVQSSVRPRTMEDGMAGRGMARRFLQLGAVPATRFASQGCNT